MMLPHTQVAHASVSNLWFAKLYYYRMTSLFQPLVSYLGLLKYFFHISLGKRKSYNNVDVVKIQTLIQRELGGPGLANGCKWNGMAKVFGKMESMEAQ